VFRQIVIMDNLTAHKGEKVRWLTEARGCGLLYVPPYSLDLDPIEDAFLKIKGIPRRAETRTREALTESIGAAISAITATDVRGFFDHCRYGASGPGIAALKKEDGPELQVQGSGNLIQTLLRHNLVDEYRLWVFPLVIGSDKRLFSEGTIPSGLKLVDSKVSTTGVVTGTYEPAGEIVTGSFALD
jgi:hypothetical protein